ncbi:hypothetical protein BH10CYA1_BH10CYA1_38570 [soil metagenome]
MKRDKTPTLKDLETLRHKLLQDLKDAPQLFGVQRNSCELLTVKAALNDIHKMLKELRKHQSRQVA